MIRPFSIVLFLIAALASTSAEEAWISAAKEAYGEENYDRVIELLASVEAGDEKEQNTRKSLLAAAHQRRGEMNFQNARIKECLVDFDQVIALIPQQAPQHWQRGIALYYGNRYEEGVAQFGLHRTVNPNDVENAVWHFLCAVRAPGGTVQKARENLIPIRHDSRIPMMTIHDLFAGKSTVEAVLAEGAQGGDRGTFYAELYVGLFLEAIGKDGEALDHIARAAVSPASANYMGDVARTHLMVREGKKEPAP